MHLQLEPELLKAIDGARGLVPRNAWIGEVLSHRVSIRQVPVPVSVQTVGAGVQAGEAVPPQPKRPVPAIPGVLKGSTLESRTLIDAALGSCATPEHKRRLVFGGTCPDCGLKMVKK